MTEVIKGAERIPSDGDPLRRAFQDICDRLNKVGISLSLSLLSFFFFSEFVRPNAKQDIFDANRYHRKVSFKIQSGNA